MKWSLARLVCVLLAGAVVLTIGACRDSTSAETTPAEAKADKGKRLPNDYVPYRCLECSCRVFSGEYENCSRPTCKHHYSVHKMP